VRIDYHTFPRDADGYDISRMRGETWSAQVSGDRLSIGSISVEWRDRGEENLDFVRVDDFASITDDDATMVDASAELVVSRMSASSLLNPTVTSTKTYTYGLDQALDGDPLTAWNEGVDGSGVGQIVEFVLEQSTTVDAVSIKAGFFDERWFRANNRVQSLELSLRLSNSTVFRRQYELEDSMTEQLLRLGDAVVTPFDTVRIKILSVYPGSQWNDLAVSEIGFVRSDGPVPIRVPEGTQTFGFK
jgi:hypothetical protein